jgi:hypothetical protein
MESLEITRRAEIFSMFSIPSFHGTKAIFITLLFYFGCAFLTFSSHLSMNSPLLLNWHWTICLKRKTMFWYLICLWIKIFLYSVLVQSAFCWADRQWVSLWRTLGAAKREKVRMFCTLIPLSSSLQNVLNWSFFTFERHCWQQAQKDWIVNVHGKKYWRIIVFCTH